VSLLKLLARQLSAVEVYKALGSQNIVLQAGDLKVKVIDWMVQRNTSPRCVLPVVPSRAKEFSIGGMSVSIQSCAYPVYHFCFFTASISL
jgi:hypothetical protein